MNPLELWTAFLLGLVGSAHCAGMCGPLVLALPAGGSTPARFVLGRSAYNLGRISTYALLGVVFGVLGKSLALAGAQRWLSIGVGCAIIAGLLMTGTRGLNGPVWGAVRWLKCGLSTLLQRKGNGAMFLFGALNGLLPCGLVYVACGGAVATGGFVSSILFMLCFGLGTVPLMLALAFPGRRLQTSLALKFRRFIPVTLGLMALLLIVRGLGLGIPYLSPAFQDGQQPVACCPH